MSTTTTNIDAKPSLQASHCEDEGRSKRKQLHPLVPGLRFNEFDGDYRVVTVNDCIEFLTDYHANGSYERLKENVELLEKEDYAIMIRTTNFEKKNFQNNLLYISEHAYNYLKKSKVLGDDIIINKIANAGATYIMPHLNRPVSLAMNLFMLRTNSNNSGKYIYYKIKTKEFRLRALSSGTGTKTITKQDVKTFKIEIPSLPEQQKIASFLSAVDEKIQQLTKKKELLEDYKKGVMQQLFSGELRFKDENGKAYPDWDWVGGNELFDNISDKKHNSDLPILAITQDQGAIPRELINYQMTVTEASVASYKVVQKGDFIISLRTFQGGIEFSDYHGICSPAYNILRPNSENVDRAFYRFYLKTSFYIRQLQKNLEGIRDGKMISYKYFSEIKVPFPSKLEQQKIARYLSGIDTKIESVNNQITQTQTFKKGLLQQLFV
jgi:type I restriction enzyme S subunit